MLSLAFGSHHDNYFNFYFSKYQQRKSLFYFRAQSLPDLYQIHFIICRYIYLEVQIQNAVGLHHLLFSTGLVIHRHILYGYLKIVGMKHRKLGTCHTLDIYI